MVTNTRVFFGLNPWGNSLPHGSMAVCLVGKRRVLLISYDVLATSLPSAANVPSTVFGAVRVTEACETLPCTNSFA